MTRLEPTALPVAAPAETALLHVRSRQMAAVAEAISAGRSALLIGENGSGTTTILARHADLLEDDHRVLRVRGSTSAHDVLDRLAEELGRVEDETGSSLPGPRPVLIADDLSLFAPAAALELLDAVRGGPVERRREGARCRGTR